MQSNISAGLPGTSAKTIAVNGGNLQNIAAQQYGDATLWPAIAKINGLSDPNLPAGAMTLQIPSPSVAQGGL
jgi:nucleoid-associated protein YgaU